uniref:Protocadherin gamma-C3 n=1 Tax=Malurus cyaneus samueli TaxID=2593467 RepID=A0A8C5U3B8_9PASS
NTLLTHKDERRWSPVLVRVLVLQAAWALAGGQVRYSVEEPLGGTVVGRLAQDLGLEAGEAEARRLRLVAQGRRASVEVSGASGALVVSSRLDREELCGKSAPCALRLEVLVERPLRVFHVELEVTDINDNAPVFRVDEEALNIAESSVPGSRFPLEGASDADIGANAQLSYTLSPSEYFSLDQKGNNDQSASLGLILIKALDRETNPVHRLVLTASDGGRPSLTGTMELVISVLDANDNAPQFNQSVYKVKVLEGSELGTLLITLSATDPDEGINSDIIYLFGKHVSTKVKEMFTIDENKGEIRIQDKLDYEERESYEIPVEARDKGSPPLSGHCKVLLELLDVNDNAPEVSVTSLSVPVPEDASVGTVVALLSVSDRDSGANGRVRCWVWPASPFGLEATFSGSAQDPDVGTNSVQNYLLSPNRHFALDLKGFQSGSKLLELVLQQPLDREQSALQQLVLTAVDGGDPPKSGTAQISVRVVDTNDNPPAFDRSTYTVSLLENSLPGTLVVKLNASDPDEGSNGDVIYSFGSYTPQKVRQLFSVDPHSGEVRVNGTLDYEEASFYEIYVQATDQGPVSLAGHCKVLVNIVDANDNVPEVQLTSLYSPVPEDARSGTVVALMSVTDQDSGLNKQVSLRIPPGLPFALNSFKNSYTLVTQGKLDHEKAAAYNITVTATDSGSPPLSSQKVIHVEISDINDNPPRFEEPVYSVYIPENNPLGAFLCTIKATDPDVAKNAYVSYSLLDGEIEGLPVASYVSIKPDSGNMYAVRSFDYETLREFQVTVQAQDAGIPPLSSTVTVYIYVVDENDHAPQILYPTSTNTSAALEMIPRSAYAGYLVTKIIAIDGDSGQNAWLFFYLVQTSDPGLFRIELHTGEIRTTRKLGEDSTPTFNLTVEVRDNGEPSMSSSVSITIAVVDRVSKIIPDRRRHFKSPSNYSEVTLYLIIALSAISFVFLFTIIGLTIIKCYRYSLYGCSCCAGCCTVRERSAADQYKQANNNIDARLPQGLKVQPHFIEVRGNGSLTKTYCYKTCLTAGSGSDTFMFYNTCGPTGTTGPSAVVTERHLTGQSGQSAQNLIILRNDSITPNEPKHPNPDWRYSASLRAGMQSAVHMEEAGVLRGGPAGPDQQWPTVSSATAEPEGGEVSPPVGAGVNSNSWTFKFGPGNSKQGGPGELPDKFIIPGSPAIISIRQEPPNSQIDKSDFITFGKKEETKKKKKKKKGNKTQEKKEKGNSTTENSDQ